MTPDTNRSTAARGLILLAFAIATWAVCGAIIGIGRQLSSMETTLVLHAIGAPLAAAGFTWACLRIGGGFSPLVTALGFVGTALALDLFLVAPVFEGSYEMFSSLLGVWIPMALIFVASFLTARGMAGTGLAGNCSPRGVAGVLHFFSQSRHLCWCHCTTRGKP